jgi:MarR family transcriptional regulator, organic hydroperoxide resistance regulator
MNEGLLLVTQGGGVIEELQHSTLDVIQKFLILYRYVRNYARKTHCEGVRGRELSILRYLQDVGPLTIGQITQYLFLSASSASELVSRMEEAGYVVRRRSNEDSRVVFVELTAKGELLAQETPLGGIPLLRERVKTLSPEQLTLIDDALSCLIEIMEINPNEF